ncbi:peptidase S41 [Flavobacterium sp. 316]|uniref:S41 family peptidase n=1 Tax=Flavobacterium sediminilitoris TaxID=2024526 RepID=A0ABY4HPU5_9FLAO|nr:MULTISPECIES: S41 family peptidase [Flavobacterium]KIX20546.1 peptidase S41 [Flavobacterium sp. 316]UOX34889.1 S41 family peptidase [Flavobacterium sediminilitoris]
MKRFFNKKYILTFFSIGFLFLAVSFKNDFFEIAKQIEIFTATFKTVNQNYVDETNPGELMNVAIKNMLAELDPYTVFFNEQDVLKFKINNTGEYTGIGAMVQRKEGRVFLKEIYKGFPADKAGLKAGDEITQIGDINLKEYKEDASQLLQGVKNTKVNITFERQGKKETTSIILDEVEVKAVPFYSLLPDNTGYIVLSKFTEKSSSETKSALLDLKQKGATKIILDLRGNPGGLLHEAVNICNLFVPRDEIIVTTKSKSEKHNNTYKTKNEPIDTEIPLAVIINDRSASASEIVSGALQDLDRAVVVGNRSFGKGLVQRPLNLSYGTQVKVTISRYYTPSGRCIQALDYAHKDKNGKAVKIDKNNFNAFKTKGGRAVYDGGGVLPDLIVEETKTSTIADALLKNDAVFDFATTLYYKTPNQTGIPSISDADFNAFKTFIKQEKYSLDSETGKALKTLLEKAKKEKIDDSIVNEYKQLQIALEKSQDQEVSKYKTEFVKLLQEELITRYQYKEGLYEFYTQKDIEISKAKTVLNTPSQYNAILKK